MTTYKTYKFDFSYSKRTEELPFIKAILTSFDNQTLTGITILVNNNIYAFEFLLLLSFEKNSDFFDTWLLVNYPQKRAHFIYNYSLVEIIDKQLKENSYNFYSFSNIEQLESVLTEESNKIFIYPSIKKVEEKWGNTIRSKDKQIFLSHSSLDKSLVENIFFELQKEELPVWFDKYEIDFGDSITDKINEGLNKSTLGLICLSKNFLLSNWAKAEMNFFIQERQKKQEPNFICLILDIEHSEIPPLLQDYRYISLKSENWFSELVTCIRKKGSHQQRYC